MAGLSLRLLAGNFSTNFIASIDAPSRIGMVAEYYLGNNNTQSQENMVDGQLDGLAVGSGMVYYPYSALLRDSGYIDTQLPSTTEFTFIAIAKKATGSIGQGQMISNFESAADPDRGVHFYSSREFNTIKLQVGDDGNEAFPETPHQNIQTDLPNQTFGNPNFAFQFARGSTSGLFINAGFFRTDIGLLQNQRSLENPRFLSTTSKELQLGRGVNGQEMAYVAIFDRVLTDQELNTHYASLKDFYIGKINID